MLHAYGLTDKGRVRPTNEDCLAIDESLGLCVVADGMGGHNAGEVAARLAVEEVVAFVHDRAGRSESQTKWPFGYDASLSNDGNLLRTGIHLANARVLDAARHADHYAGMGTTIVAARASRGRLTVAHVGDSRLYLMASRQLLQVTHDDSWMASIREQDPHADPLLLMHHPLRNALTNVVGGRALTEVHVADIPLAGGELLLLSTDGVHGVVDDERLLRLLTEEDDLEAIAKSVVATALMRGSRDNCTAVVARYTCDGVS